jgi:hypothetical protein
VRLTVYLTLALAALALMCAPSSSINYATPAQNQMPPAPAPVTSNQPVPEGAKEILADGAAAIIGGDKGIARDHAIQDAQRKAVEQGVGALLKSETEVKNFQLVYDRISTKATGYVSSYKVIAEDATADLYRVTIRAVVKMADLENDVSAILNLIESQGRPRLLVLIRDTREGSDELADPDLASDLETMIVDHFVTKGFPVVDAEMVRRNLTRDQVKLILAGDNQTAAQLGTKLGAEIVLAGKATASEARKTIPYGNEVRDFYGTTLNARAINAATSEILTAALITKDLPFSRDASRKEAAEEVSDKMIADILKKWQVQNIVTQIFCINADNTRLKALQDGLNTNIRGLSRVLLRDFTGSSGMIEVLATTNSQEVYDRLNAPGWNVAFTIKGFSGNRIDLEFK